MKSGTGAIKKHFDAGETSSITDVTQKKLRYWVDTKIIVPAKTEGEGHAKRHYYDFLNLIEIRTIVALRQKNLPLQRIRKAISFLEEEWRISRPLIRLSLFTDGQTVFFVGNDPEYVFDILRRGQAVFAIAIDEIVKMLSDRLNVSFREISNNWEEYVATSRPKEQVS